VGHCGASAGHLELHGFVTAWKRQFKLSNKYLKYNKIRGLIKVSLERTLSIIKPDAVAKNVIGEIYSRFERANLKIVAARMEHLTREQAEGFYAVHRERPFFAALVEFMTSGPVMIQALEGDNAIASNRELMGATNPGEAAEGTIRADFAESIDANAVHGSDGPDTAKAEIEYFFGPQALDAQV
jgi:nucleoside-diphosphate kinase